MTINARQTAESLLGQVARLVQSQRALRMQKRQLRSAKRLGQRPLLSGLGVQGVHDLLLSLLERRRQDQPLDERHDQETVRRHGHGNLRRFHSAGTGLEELEFSGPCSP